MSVRTVDVAVIGAGVLGCMCARNLSRYKLDVLVIERAGDVGEGSSKANCGIIHTGFHARGGTLKGTSCVQGNALYTQLAQELEVPFKRVGALYCAYGPNGLEKMAQKRERAYQNGAGRLPLLSGDEARAMEPRLSSDVVAAFYAQTTGIISPFALVVATAENAAQNGVEFCFNAAVERIERTAGMWLLHLNTGDAVKARYVLNAAGDQAAILDAQVHEADLVIRPRRGQFYVFDKQGGADAPQPLQHVLFQAQESDEGGTLVAPTIDGNVLAGPTAEQVRYFHQNATSAQGLEHVRRVARKLVPDLDMSRVITEFAGVRANIANLDKEHKDFVVRLSAPGFVSTLGIKNPGMTSSPALAQRAVDLLRQDGLQLEADPSFDPHRRARIPFLQCDAQEQARLLKQDPSFGHVLCRCEQITEGDVRRELRGVLPPHDFEGLKHRLRVSMGRCQGGFCKPRVMELLRERDDGERGDEAAALAVDCEPSSAASAPAGSAASGLAESAPVSLASLELSSDLKSPLKLDVLVVGGGAAGIAAAAAASECGATTLLVEREEYLGGVLPQCIHDGFGMYLYGQSLTGPQYNERWLQRLAQSGANWACQTSVTQLVPHAAGGFEAQVVGCALGGPRTVLAKSVVVASGCREVTRGQLRIPGTRPEGVYTAGTAQFMVNIQHKLPGDKVVILGGGDIGLIMARRMTLSGAQVRMVVAKEATGLVRNHRRCIDPYGIETRYGWGVASIHGYGRLKGVMVAPFGDDGQLDMKRREYVRCNTLLISCGLVPERELFAGVQDEPGLFVCGNADSVHDLVDRVSVEALRVGAHAAAHAGCKRALSADLECIAKIAVPQLPVGERV